MNACASRTTEVHALHSYRTWSNTECQSCSCVLGMWVQRWEAQPLHWTSAKHNNSFAVPSKPCHLTLLATGSTGARPTSHAGTTPRPTRMMHTCIASPHRMRAHVHAECWAAPRARCRQATRPPLPQCPAVRCRQSRSSAPVTCMHATHVRWTSSCMHAWCCMHDGRKWTTAQRAGGQEQAQAGRSGRRAVGCLADKTPASPHKMPYAKETPTHFLALMRSSLRFATVADALGIDVAVVGVLPPLPSCHIQPNWGGAAGSVAGCAPCSTAPALLPAAGAAVAPAPSLAHCGRRRRLPGGAAGHGSCGRPPRPVQPGRE